MLFFGVFSLHVGRVFEGRAFQNTWPLGLAHDDLENSKRAFWRTPALQTPPKFHEKTPIKSTKSEISSGSRNKKREILFHLFWVCPSLPTLQGATLLGPLPSLGHFFWVWPPSPFGSLCCCLCCCLCCFCCRSGCCLCCFCCCSCWFDGVFAHDNVSRWEEGTKFKTRKNLSGELSGVTEQFESVEGVHEESSRCRRGVDVMLGSSIS